ncbi:hypothetical protein QYE76_004356 [Lolium multiflorum]|uniref:Legume lectin domain-containing protein n=1 Tax=Lolium multiflorum TaxID=4521 RepID=A0AAD8RUI1_LOLMU|nr:hypothetical protein QYE76_004356 [Lolium multiflorum]
MPQFLLVLLYFGCFILSLPLDAPQQGRADRCATLARSGGFPGSFGAEQCIPLSSPLDSGPGFCRPGPAPQHVAAAATPISFSFDFTNKSSYNGHDIHPEGSAGVGPDVVDVTCNSQDRRSRGCAGRVSYNHSVPFYNKATGEVASFTTQFAFRIMMLELDNNTQQGDGMAFFLSSYPSALPPDSDGLGLGLAHRESGTGYGVDRFIAVEFDTFNNFFEPQVGSDHMGIDLSSVLHSVNTTRLPGNGRFTRSGNMTASINFDSSTMMLVARLHFDDDPSLPPLETSARLPDPLTLLPSEVSVGFSGATGLNMELHQIFSWSFSSTLARPRKPVSIAAAVRPTRSSVVRSGGSHDQSAQHGDGTSAAIEAGVTCQSFTSASATSEPPPLLSQILLGF